MYFSIVIPTYNRRHELQRCLESVARQTLQDFEIIVIDDGSTDATAEFLQALPEHITCIYQKNSGPSRARNVGLSIARGVYVLFLDSDDELQPSCLAEFFAASYPVFPAIVSGNVTIGSFEKNGFEKFSATFWTSFSAYIQQNTSYDYPFPSATIVKTEIAKKVGGFPGTRTYAEDLDFWIRLAEESGFVKINGKSQTVRNLHVNQLSHRDGPVTLGLLRIAFQLSFRKPKPSVAMQNLLYEGLERHRNWVRSNRKYLSTLALNLSMLRYRNAWETLHSGGKTI